LVHSQKNGLPTTAELIQQEYQRVAQSVAIPLGCDLNESAIQSEKESGKESNKGKRHSGYGLNRTNSLCANFEQCIV